MLFWLAGSCAAFTQQSVPVSAPVPLIVQSINENNLVELKGNVHPSAKPALDQGAADDSLSLQRMMLVFKRGEAQEAALKKFLDDQKNSKSTNYRKWLTPEQSSIARASLNLAGKLLNPGNNSITASYAGDGNYVSSTSAAVTVFYTPPFSLSLGQPSVVVQSGSSTTVAVTLTANGSHLPATVTLSCPQPVPAGLSCTFSTAVVAMGSSTTTSTLTLQAVFPPSNSTMGQSAPIKAQMVSTGGILAFTSLAILVLPVGRRRIGILSSIGVLLLGLVVNGCGGGGSHTPPAPAATITTISSSPVSGPQGTTFTFTANVAGSGSSESPTGTVTFSDGNSVLGSGSVIKGTATFSSSSLILGSHSVVASYSGDTNFLPSSSSKATTTDVQYQTTLSLSASDSLGNVTVVQVPVTVQ